ncbi:MAG: sigma-70 family RNA polymerase sigma factor [Planctomycetota bacterium]
MADRPNNTAKTGQDDMQRRFLPLWTQHQRRVFAYIYTLIPNRADAEDLLQETSITLWEKFAEFEEGTDFVAWACQVAYWKIRNARRKYARSPIIHNDELLSSLSDKAIAAQPELNRRHDALADCLGKLSDRDHALVMSRYETDSTIKEVASQTGRSVEAAYKALFRIRQALMDCVTFRLEGFGS